MADRDDDALEDALRALATERSVIACGSSTCEAAIPCLPRPRRCARLT